MKMNEMYLKRFIVLAFILTLAIFLVACGSDSKSDSSSSSNSDSSSSSSSSSDSNDNDTDASSDSDEVYEFRFNSFITPSDYEWEPKMKSQEHFVKYIEEETNGRVKLELFHNNQLASQAESLDALARGTFEFQNISPVYWAGKVPEGSFFGLPFWTMAEEHAYHIIRDTEIGKIYEEALIEYGVRPLMYWPSGIHGFNSKGKPITKPEDLKGLVYNISSDLSRDYYTGMGAGAATVQIVEFYEAFLRGTLDAMDFPYSGLESLALHEVIDYITLPAILNPAMGMIAINNETWESLPTDIQEGILRAVDRLEKEASDGSKMLTERAIDYAVEHGVEVVNMTEEAYNEFLERAKAEVWNKFAGINDRTKRMVEILEEETDRWLEENPDKREEFEAYLK